MRRLHLILMLLIPCLLVSVALSDDLITAKVVSVADGDSITVYMALIVQRAVRHLEKRPSSSLQISVSARPLPIARWILIDTAGLWPRYILMMAGN
jgi:hypothetical protein